MRLLKIIVILLLAGLVTVKTSQAQTEFATDYQVRYTVLPSGTTHARIEITLTNKLSNIYAQEFSFVIGSTKLSQIKAYNEKQTLEPQLVYGQQTTKITIAFPEKVLGKDRFQSFTLEFDSADFSHRLGQVWEISIPRLSESADLKSYSVSLAIPGSFGKPANLSPRPVSSSQEAGYTIYRFDPQALIDQGITATFGQVQYFDFQLNYVLQNPNLFPVKTELALPPDTAYQTVLYQTLEPRPQSISVDSDGNWLASYSLGSRQSLVVTATGSAQIFLNPKTEFPPPSADLNQYLEEKQYWELNHPKIRQLASELKTPKNIYQYLVDNLIYDYGRLSANSTTRFGAANALDNPTSALCLEFTDLFVALSRAAGIPARSVNGFAYTTNPKLRPLSLKQDVLHAWPEFYDSDQKRWRPVDPTWGNTTGGVDFFNRTDLNHFSFSIQGLDSTYPIPAGAYKSNTDQKQVNVEFGPVRKPQAQLELGFNLASSALAGMPLKGELVVTNSGNVGLYQQTVSLTASNLDLAPMSWTIPVLPPFGRFTLPLEIPAPGWQQNFTSVLTASTELATVSHQLSFTSVPLIGYLTISLSGLIGLVVIVKLIRAKINS